MQLLAIAALLFVARVAAEQPQEVSNAQPVPVVSGQQQPVGQIVPVVDQHQAVPAHHQPGPQQVVPHYGAQSYPSEQHQAAHAQASYVHSQQQQQQQHQQQAAPQQYAPAGLVQVVNAADNKPYVQVQQGFSPNHYAAGAIGGEQYGQPEPAGIPPNYKPFGSWGLYIGGNPAEGYYSNYYKALSNSVDKQQVGAVDQAAAVAAVKPAVAGASGVNQASAFGPMLKQASYPYSSYQDQVYPFDYYTQSDLSSPASPSSYSPASVSGGRVSPVQVGAQVYGAPVAFTGSEQPSSYVDSSASKRSAAAGGQQQVKSESQLQPSPAKGFVQKRYGYASYAPPSVMPYNHQQQHNPQYQYQAAAPQQPGQQAQVLAYPVPVGSQIVGSQPGADGAYQPYGVHGYTRYAIKPTVMATEQSYYQQQQAPQFPVYKQQQQTAVSYQPQHQQPQPQQQQQQAVYQPLGFYGYPLSQLHYSQGAIVPAFQSSVSPVEQQVGASSVYPIDAASSEKSETTVEKPQSTATVHKQHQPQQPHQH